MLVAGRRCEFDGIYLHKNILLIVEDTTLARPDGIRDHLRGKKEIFSHVCDNQEVLIDVLSDKHDQFARYIHDHDYHWTEYGIQCLYCSLHTVQDRYQARYGDRVAFLDRSQLLYFLGLSKSIRMSARYELFDFLGLKIADIGVDANASTIAQYKGLLLPEGPSGFPTGHKLVSFLVDPQRLLEQCYVLRADSWRDTECLYQRLMIKSKIASMREFLADERRVYVNNIIVTMPPETRLRDANGRSISMAQANRTMPVVIQIPKSFNSIGIIDGQHRVYSYHEGNDRHEARISQMRPRQHLLITGIIYPEGMSELKKQRFEARMFLEINAKQSRVKSDLRQAIELLVNPYSAIAIGKGIVLRLASAGPLANLLEAHFYDTGKIKTASVVSYGLARIVAIDGDLSFFTEWRGRDKQKLKKRQNLDALTRYRDYCANELNLLISGFESAVSNELWTLDKKKSRVLTTTTINGLVYCMRRLIETNKRGNYAYYARRFERMRIDFRPDNFPYKSSHWKDLGEKIFRQCFIRR